MCIVVHVVFKNKMGQQSVYILVLGDDIFGLDKTVVQEGGNDLSVEQNGQKNKPFFQGLK